MKNNFLLIILFFLVVSCGKNEKEKIDSNEWKSIEINYEIKNSVNFKIFSGKKEFSILFDSTTLQNKTNNIFFSSRKN